MGSFRLSDNGLTSGSGSTNEALAYENRNQVGRPKSRRATREYHRKPQIVGDDEALAHWLYMAMGPTPKRLQNNKLSQS